MKLMGIDIKSLESFRDEFILCKGYDNKPILFDLKNNKIETNINYDKIFILGNNLLVGINYKEKSKFLIDRNYSIISKIQDFNINGYINGFINIKQENNTYILDSSLNKFLVKEVDNIIYYTKNGEFSFIMDNKYGIKNIKDNIILEPKYSSINLNKEGFGAIELNGDYSFFDISKKGKLDFSFDLIGYPNETYSVMKGDMWGFENISGGKTNIIFYKTGNFENGAGAVRTNKGYGVINSTFKDYIIEPSKNYTKISNISEEKFNITDTRFKKAFFNVNGKQLTDFVYDVVYDFKDGYSIIKEKEKSVLIDSNFNKITEPSSLLYKSEENILFGNTKELQIINLNTLGYYKETEEFNCLEEL